MLPFNRMMVILQLPWLFAIAAYSIKSDIPKTADEDGLNFGAFHIAADNNAGKSFTIPFTRAGNLILVKATADTIQGNFILDTGAPHLILNITYFRNYPSTLISDAEQTSITGVGQAIYKTVINKFDFAGIQYKRLEADLANLGHIENSKGVRIFGLLGMELFRQCEMIIDYENNLIHLHVISKAEAATYQHPQLSDASKYSVVPIDLMDNKIVTRLNIGGKNLKFIIDHGAETNLIDSRLSNKVFENVNITGRVVLTGSANKKIEALAGNMNNLVIGNAKFNDLPVLITNLEKTCFAYGGCIDGILGFDFLSLHKIGFNFVNRKMYIWK